MTIAVVLLASLVILLLVILQASERYIDVLHADIEKRDDTIRLLCARLLREIEEPLPDNVVPLRLIKE